MALKIIEEYYAAMQPHVRHIGNQATMYADRICQHLADIHAALVADDEIRRAVNRVLPASNGGSDPLAHVPSGEVWVLEYAAADETVNTTLLRLFQDNSLRACQANWSGADLTAMFGTRFVGPCDINAFNANPFAAVVYFQFRRIARKPRRADPTWTGQQTTGLAPTGAERHHDPLHGGLGVRTG